MLNGGGIWRYVGEYGKNGGQVNDCWDSYDSLPWNLDIQNSKQQPG